MTLEEMFAQINANYSNVVAIANSVYIPVRAHIDKYLNQVDWYARYAMSEVGSGTSNLDTALALAVTNINYTLERLLYEILTGVASQRSSIISIFSTSMAYVTTWIQNAIAEVNYSIEDQIDDLRSDIDLSIMSMMDYLDVQIAYMQAEVTAATSNAQDWLSTELETINNTLDTRISAVEESINASIQTMKEYNNEVKVAIYTHIKEEDQKLMQSIVDLESTMHGHVAAQVERLERMMENILRSLTHRIATDVNRLEEEILANTVMLTDKINELVAAGTWQFSFFDLFTFRPELALLRVLLRSQTDFERYKPYWQALIARVLEED